MVFDSVPWAVHGGVKHSASTARMLVYAASGGEEGIAGARDLEVKPLPTPGAGVRVMPGACSVINRVATASYEAYSGRSRTAEDIAIGATGAAGRSDLVCVRVEDPFEDPARWSAPSQTAIDDGTARFIFTRVITGVDITRDPRAILADNGYSAIPLAFVTQAANSSSITTAKITDLRQLTQPRRSEAMFIVTMSSATPRRLTNTDYVVWPQEMSTTVDVPRWATHALMRAIMGGVTYGATGNNSGAGWGANGQLRLQLDTIDGDPVAYNVSTDSGTDRVTLMTATPRVAIPSTLRGKSARLRLMGTRAAGSTALEANGGTTATLEVVFLEHPELTG